MNRTAKPTAMLPTINAVLFSSCCIAIACVVGEIADCCMGSADCDVVVGIVIGFFSNRDVVEAPSNKLCSFIHVL